MPGVLSVRDLGTIIISAPRRIDMFVLSTDNIDDTKVLEDVHVPSKTTLF